jgi:hypothetical protein
MKQLNSNRPKAMDKETFMQQYVLNRAGCVLAEDVEFNYKEAGFRLAHEAIEAWDTMQNELTKSDGGSDE